jgi:hypothetical protein
MGNWTDGWGQAALDWLSLSDLLSADFDSIDDMSGRYMWGSHVNDSKPFKV